MTETKTEFLVSKQRQCGSMCAHSYRYHCICLSYIVWTNKHIPSREIAIHEKQRQMRLVFRTMRFIYDDIQLWTRYHNDICLPIRLFDSFDHNYNVSLIVHKIRKRHQSVNQSFNTLAACHIIACKCWIEMVLFKNRWPNPEKKYKIEMKLGMYECALTNKTQMELEKKYVHWSFNGKK